MNSPFQAIPGAFGFRCDNTRLVLFSHSFRVSYRDSLSNPCVLSTTALRASLKLFDKAGIRNLRKKSLLLTGTHSPSPYYCFLHRHVFRLSVCRSFALTNPFLWDAVVNLSRLPGNFA